MSKANISVAVNYCSKKKRGFKQCPVNPLIPLGNVVSVTLPGLFSLAIFYVIPRPLKWHLHEDGTHC